MVLSWVDLLQLLFGFGTINKKSRGIAKIGEARGLSGNRMKGRMKTHFPLSL